MAFLWNVLLFAMAIATMTVDAVYKLQASDNACYSATEFVSNYTFNPPADGTVIGVELEHVSGGVSCGNPQPLNAWGCGYTWGVTAFGDALMMNLLQHNDDGTETTIYPTTTMDDVSDFNSYSTCSNGHGCSVQYFTMSGYNFNSSSLVYMDEANPITVAVDDTFSVQYSEGCCGTSTSDNRGTACAMVYFYYLGDLITSADPTTEPTVAPTEFHCVEHGCDDQLVCEETSGECVRNCDVFQIDDFLLDCSAEWDSNDNTVTAMATSIADNTADIGTVTTSAATNAAAITSVTDSTTTNAADIVNNVADIATLTASAASNAVDIATVTASAATNAADIASNAGDIGTVTTSVASNAADITTVTATTATNAADIAANTAFIGNLSSSVASNEADTTSMAADFAAMQTSIDAIETALSQMGALSAHTQLGNVDGSEVVDVVGGGLWSGYALSTKDWVIITLLIMNVVLMIIGVVTVCSRNAVGTTKYHAVNVACD